MGVMYMKVNQNFHTKTKSAHSEKLGLLTASERPAEGPAGGLLHYSGKGTCS